VIMGGAFTAVAVIAGVVYWNVSNERRQKETDAKLEALQKQLDRQIAAAAPASQAAPLGVGNGGVPATSAIGRQNDVNQALAMAGPLISSGDADKARTAANILQETIDKADAANPDLYAALGRADLLM